MNFAYACEKFLGGIDWKKKFTLDQISTNHSLSLLFWYTV